MEIKYDDLIVKIKSGECASNASEFDEYVSVFLDDAAKDKRMQLYIDKMKEGKLANLAEAKHFYTKQVFEDYIKFALSEANSAAARKNDRDAQKIIDQLGKLRDVFKNHDVIDYKDFILQSENKISGLEVELLFLEPELNPQELDRLTKAFINSFKKNNFAGQDKNDFQKKFFNHPLMQCLDAYSSIRTIEKHIGNETIELGQYKNLIQSMLGLREKINAEEYQGFITFVIHEDLTYGLSNIIKNEYYKPKFLRELLKDLADGKALENNALKELIKQIKIEHTTNLALNTRKELVKNISSIASLNDYGFEVKILSEKKPVLFHGHATENAGGNQREQQANTAFIIRSFNQDTIGLTVLKDEVTRTDYHSNFLTDFAHLINLTKTEEIILSGLQFDASNFKYLAFDCTLDSLKKSDFLSSNHYIVKADIKRSQKIINLNLGKNDLELICEKKNAYMNIVRNNKELIKSVLDTTSTNNQLAFQLLSVPFVDFVDAVLNIEESAKLFLFNNKDVELIREIFSVKSLNLQLETSKRHCLKLISFRDRSELHHVSASKLNNLMLCGSSDPEIVNREEHKNNLKANNHVKLLKNPAISLDECLEYIENNPIEDRLLYKSYKNKVINALKDKLLDTAQKTLMYSIDEKKSLLTGITEIANNLKNGADIVFKSEDDKLKGKKISCKKTLATLLKGNSKFKSQVARNVSLLAGLCTLADLCGSKLIHGEMDLKNTLPKESSKKAKC